MPTARRSGSAPAAGKARSGRRPREVGTSQSQQTRQRLLTAAGQAFADKGLRSATVRDICRRAGANIAAVNYHFGGKEQLYHATLTHWIERAADRYPLEPDPPVGTPRQRLRHFVRAMLWRILDEGKPAWHGRLMLREMSEPTAFMDEHVRRFVIPTMGVLHGILRDWLGLPAVATGGEGEAPPRLDAEPRVRRLAASIIGQIVLYHTGREVLPKLYGRDLMTAQELDALAEHITAFSAAGLDAEAERVAKP